MMKTTSVPLAVLLICLMVFAPICHCSRVLLQDKKNSIIEQTCNKVGHDVNLCITSLDRIPGSAQADVKGLAFIMAKDVLYGARNETVNKIQGLLKQSPGDNRLKTCLLHYSAIEIDILQTITGHIPHHEYKAVEKTMQDIVFQSQSCEALFTKPPQPLKNENYLVFALAQLVEDIIVL